VSVGTIFTLPRKIPSAAKLAAAGSAADRSSVPRSPCRTLYIGALAAALLLLPLQDARAQGEGPGASNESCLECHSDPTLNMPLGNGELISLYIDGEIFSASVHGEAGYACVQCHTDLRDYPHATFTAEDRRDLGIQLYTACQRCHSGEYERTLDSAHDQARALGIREAAICTDCHGAHNIRRLTDADTGELTHDSRPWIPQTCARCHNAIYEKYLTSVHGAALLEQSNLDVPSCIDCHGVHDIEDPRTTTFRLKSPQLCAGCHTDEVLMAEYGISTAVLETYVADFHGTTVTLFEKQSPDAETNKPVCFDCHGVHDIKETDDPEKGLQVRENLLARCQICHPGATTQFPDSWLSHYAPSADKHPLVYIVDTFYKIFIPAVLGGMGVLVALDLGWRVRRRIAERNATSKQLEDGSSLGTLPVAINPRTDGGAGSIDPTKPHTNDRSVNSKAGNVDE
jgi:predicted CXXCH cytochrome family protein